MTARTDQVYLRHILECAALIRNYTASGQAEFIKNTLVQDAVLRRLQTMAESTQRLSDSIKAQAPEIDWRALSGFRNVLAHDYLGGINLNQIWDVLESDLPGSEATARRLIHEGS